MNSLLALLERVLIGIFAVIFLVVAGAVYFHFHNRSAQDNDPWIRAKRSNEIDAYFEYLKECDKCPHGSEAENTIEKLQKSFGLVSRLESKRSTEKSGFSLPAFSPDARHILTSSGRGPEFWDSETGQYLARGKNDFPYRSGAIASLDYASVGQRVAAGTAGSGNGYLIAWDEPTGKLLAEHVVEGFDVQLVQFAPDKPLLGWLADGGTLGVWDSTSGQFLRGIHDGAKSLAFFRTDNGRLLLLTASGREVWSWDPQTMETVRQVQNNSDRPLLGLSRDGSVVAYSDGTVVEIWNTRTGLQVSALRDLTGDITSFCKVPGNSWLAIGTTEGQLYLWDPDTSPVPISHVRAHRGPLEKLTCSDRNRLLSIGWDGGRVWNIEKLGKAGQNRPGAEP